MTYSCAIYIFSLSILPLQNLYHSPRTIVLMDKKTVFLSINGKEPYVRILTTRDNILHSLLLCYVIAVVFVLFFRAEHHFWDFSVYYYSGACVEQSVTPYNGTTMSQISGGKTDLPFVYPPLTLHAFSFLRIWDYSMSASVYFVIKIFALCCLIVLWKRHFINSGGSLFSLCLVFAFHSPFYIDMRSGNITVFVQLLLWLSFWAFMRRQYGLFCILLFCASVWKITPLFFLILLAMAETRKKYMYMAMTVLACIAYGAANRFLEPQLWHEWIAGALSTINESGISNPSVFSFCHFIMERLYFINTIMPVQQSTMILWGIMVIVCGVCTFQTLRRLHSSDHPLFEHRLMITISLLCFVYSFFTPRFKDYDYVLLIVPAYYIIERLFPQKKMIYALAVCLTPVFSSTLLGTRFADTLVTMYYPLFCTMVLWYAAVYTVHKNRVIETH